MKKLQALAVPLPPVEDRPQARHYSGDGSHWFWDRVKQLPDTSHREVYSLGCALQDLENRAMRALENAEADMTQHVEDTRSLTPDWQPIETAPKDVFVLVYWPYWANEPVVAKWRTPSRRWESEVAVSTEGPDPTHWMPLPASPTAREDQ
jgi:hypothetical protein